MKNNIPLLIANGSVTNAKILFRASKISSEIICTDGAVNNILLEQITPDVIIGDLDSISPKSYSKLSSHTTVIEKPSQNETDLEKALDYLIDKKYKQVLITGVKGKRLDHAICNLSILSRYSNRIQIIIFDNDGLATILNTDTNQLVSFKTKPNVVISLLALPLAKGITCSGLNYTLNNEDLTWGIREGQSNYATHEQVSISLESGVLFVYVYDQLTNISNYFEFCKEK